MAAMVSDMPEGTEETSWVKVVSYQQVVEHVPQRSMAEDLVYSRELLCAIHYQLLNRHVAAKASSHGTITRKELRLPTPMSSSRPSNKPD